jgi:hypothetical protein
MFNDVINGPASGEGCIMWPYGTARGYPSIGRQGHSRKVHREVCSHFNGERGPDMDAMHSCHQRLCIAPWHLSWGPRAQNIADMVAADRHARGERNGKSKFTEQQIADIRHSPLSQSELGRLYGVSPSTISRIINRVSWKEGPHA